MVPLPSCLGGETCETALEAQCVIYMDELSLDHINVTQGTRLNVALKNINDYAKSQTQAISVVEQDDTNTVDLDGNGLEATPLKANVRISPKEGNILVKETDGLYTAVNEAFVQQILDLIKATPALHMYLCKELNAHCSDFDCQVSAPLLSAD